MAKRRRTGLLDAGRLSGGRRPVIQVRVDPELRERVEAVARQEGASFPEAVRALLVLGLERVEGRRGGRRPG